MKTPLDRALNDMTTLLSKDHSEKEWKWSVLHVLRAMAVELQTPMIQVINQGPVKIDDDIKDILGRMKEKQGPQRTFHNPKQERYHDI